MHRFQHSFVVRADIARVWDFYTNIKHLQVISPPGLQIRVVKVTHEKLLEGSEVWLEGKLVTHSKWHSKITSLKPYQYVDEMLSGRFKVWKHMHGFKSEGGCDTLVIDEIDFELPYGLLGQLFEGYVNRRLERTFAYRKQATISYFEKAR